ncbi:hypothetical protein HDU76_009870 [Blyttiomyces sp. JEL0837]|nr:hypothetical protein HDU76_009870 [Blyttiomyces sp. JEL0837]
MTTNDSFVLLLDDDDEMDGPFNPPPRNTAANNSTTDSMEIDTAFPQMQSLASSTDDRPIQQQPVQSQQGQSSSSPSIPIPVSLNSSNIQPPPQQQPQNQPPLTPVNPPPPSQSDMLASLAPPPSHPPVIVSTYHLPKSKQPHRPLSHLRNCQVELIPASSHSLDAWKSGKLPRCGFTKTGSATNSPTPMSPSTTPSSKVPTGQISKSLSLNFSNPDCDQHATSKRMWTRMFANASVNGTTGTSYSSTASNARTGVGSGTGSTGGGLVGGINEGGAGDDDGALADLSAGVGGLVMDIAIGRGVFYPDGFGAGIVRRGHMEHRQNEPGERLRRRERKRKRMEDSNGGGKKVASGDGEKVGDDDDDDEEDGFMDVDGETDVGEVERKQLAERVDVVVATDQGLLVALDPADAEEDIFFETRGSCVTVLKLQKLLEHTSCDIVTGDSEGSVSIITRQRTILQKPSQAPITCIVHRTNPDGEVEVITGDANGALMAFNVFDRLWRLQVGGVTPIGAPRDYDHSIYAMHSWTVWDQEGSPIDYLLVCDGSPRLQFMQEDEVIFWIQTPCIIHSICSGYFWRQEGSTTMKDPDRRKNQILLAGQDGNIYLLENYQLHFYAYTESTITRMNSFRPAGSNKTSVDHVACIGHFNSLNFYQNGEMVYSIPAPDWIGSFAIGDINGDGDDEVVFATCSGIVEAHKMSVNRRSLAAVKELQPAPLSQDHLRKKAILDTILRVANGDDDLNIFDKLMVVEEEEEGEISE